MIEKYAYLIISLAITIYLVRKHQPKNVFIAFVVCFWIFVSDVANAPEFIIKIPGAPFELQPLRTLLLACLAYLFINDAFKRYKVNKATPDQVASVQPRYEIYLKAYIFITLVSYIIHYSLIGPAELIISATAILVFYVVYVTVKKTADQGMVRVIRDAIITMALISSVVAVYQLLIDGSFLRVLPTFDRPAFGGLARSTGVFRDDYMHSYAVIIGLIWAIFTIPDGVKKLVIVGIFLIGILFAFMRMGYIVTFVFFVHYFYFTYKGNTSVKALIVVGSIILFTLGFGWITTSGVLESSVAQERMLDEGTTEIRGRLYLQAVESSVKSVKSFLFGYGSEASSEYYDAMYKATHQLDWATGEVGGWHNLYLDILFFHGVGATIAFIIFLYQATRYYYRIGMYEDRLFLIPFYCVIAFVIANLSLALPVYSNFGMLVGITFALALCQRKNRLNNQPSQQPIENVMHNS